MLVEFVEGKAACSQTQRDDRAQRGYHQSKNIKPYPKGYLINSPIQLVYQIAHYPRFLYREFVGCVMGHSGRQPK